MRRKNTTTDMMKEYIAESLLMLMADKPYEAITIGAIAEKAGVNRSTYYRHFNAKEEIIEFYFLRIIGRYMEAVSQVRTISTGEYLVGMFTAFQNHKQQLLLIHRSGVSHHILNALNAAFTAERCGGIFEERFQVYYHTGGIYNSFLLWFEENMEKSPRAMAQAVVRTLPAGFVPMLLRKKR